MITACALVTAEEGAAALGEPVDPPSEQIINPGGGNVAAVSQCTLQASASPRKTLSVFLRRSPVADSRPDSVRRTLAESGVTTRDVAGTGDAAFWGAAQLHVFSGPDLYLIVTVSGLADEDALAQAEGIARQALSRAR
jgi:hypothetical protein